MNKRKPNSGKKANTKMATIEKKYGKDFGATLDKKLDNYLKEKGYKSLNELLIP